MWLSFAAFGMYICTVHCWLRSTVTDHLHKEGKQKRTKKKKKKAMLENVTCAVAPPMQAFFLSCRATSDATR
jgi:hypothetical protein